MSKIIEIWQKSDKFVLFPLISSLISILAIVGLYLVFLNNLPSKLPLLYSLPWGQSQLVSKQQFLLLPAVLIFINLINSLLSLQLHPVQFILKRMLMISLVLINLMVLITAIKILLIFI